ncbi:MAG: hypothetical protein KAT43_05335 [Nanoarchaeota archaeon]|nr:hypothetical protein [Nanoarchaeota archaeon]
MPQGVIDNIVYDKKTGKPRVAFVRLRGTNAKYQAFNELNKFRLNDVVEFDIETPINIGGVGTAKIKKVLRTAQQGSRRDL